MRLALEILLNDLQGQLKTFGIHAADKQEIDLAVSDPEMLAHAKLPFFDSKNADGFNTLSAEAQAHINSVMVDANQHEFSKNVGIALWNAAVRALYIHDNPIKAGLNKANTEYVDSQYLYMDNDRKTKRSKREGMEVEKLYSPTATPSIVDLRTLAMAKSYLKFINVLVNDPHALDELEKNIGFSGKTALSIKGITIDQVKGVIIQKAVATQEELKNRIAAFEARMQYNAQNKEERAIENKRVAGIVDEATQLNHAALDKFDHYYKILSRIKDANRNIFANSSEMSYSAKIERVKSQIAELDRAIDSFPSVESIQAAVVDLQQMQSKQSITPLFQLPDNYLSTVAEDFKSHGSYTMGDQITRADKKIQQIFDTHIACFKFFIEQRESEIQALNKMKSTLGSLVPALEELNRVSNAISRATPLITSTKPDVDHSNETIEKLLAHQEVLQNKLRGLDHSLVELEAQPTENFSAQKEFEQGLQSLNLKSITEQLQAERDSCHAQLHSVAIQIRKKELEKAQGSIAGLIKLKQEADSWAGIHSNTLRTVQKERMRLTSYARIAQESIDEIEKKYSVGITKTEALIKKKLQFIAQNEIHYSDSVISSTEKLEALKEQLLDAKDLFKETGIPVSEAQFQQLKLLLNWDEDLIDKWSYIKDNSTMGWLSRGLSRTTSSISLTNAPEQPLLSAIEDRLNAIDLSVARKKSLEKSQAQLEKLRSAVKNESTPYLSQKHDAESKIKAATAEIEAIQDEIDIQNEIISSANQSVEKSFLELTIKLNKIELNRANLTEIKNEFTQLSKTASGIFKIKHMQAFRDFNTLYSAKELALSKQEKQAASQHASVVAPVHMEEVVADPAPESPLYNKYFSIDENNPNNTGLATQYLAKRAASYAIFDKLDYAFTHGMNFFSCGGSKVKTDQQARIDYLGSIANALASNTQRSIGHAYHLINRVLDDPNKFPARAAEGSASYKQSLRALLTNMKSDLEESYPDLARREEVVSAHL